MKERNRLRTVQRRKANWICHILRSNLLLNHFSEGNVDGSRRRERRRKELLEDLKERTKTRIWKTERYIALSGGLADISQDRLHSE